MFFDVTRLPCSAPLCAAFRQYIDSNFKIVSSHYITQKIDTQLSAYQNLIDKCDKYIEMHSNHHFELETSTNGYNTHE